MAVQPNIKRPLCLGLLAHVGAGRRAPHFYSFIPGPKTGDFSYPAKGKPFQGSTIPPYVVVLHEQKPQHMVVNFRDSVFVAVFRAENEVGIDENISVGCKREFRLTE